MRIPCSLLLLLCLLAHEAGAQTVTGEVVSAENAMPVEGAIVVIEDAQGTVRAGTLSDERGRFTLNAPRPGDYRLRAERIGFGTAVSPLLRLAVGHRVDHRFELAPEAVALHGITVRTTRRCRARPDAAVETYRVWEAARKALMAVALTESLHEVRFRIRTFDREFDSTGRVLAEERSERRVVADYPFRSDPRAQWSERGFVQQVGGEWAFHAPDAHVLLSDEFLGAYCFSLRRSADRPGMIGLAFQPMPQRRHTAGVTGALWLDEQSAELRQMEYRYTQLPQGSSTRLPHSPDPGSYGGSMDFERLDSGAWIVRSWVVRVPHYYAAARVGAAQTRLGARETGGDVLEIQQPQGALRFAVVAGGVRGLVLDADQRLPVEGAVVFLSGTQYQATTGAAGEFDLAGVPEGLYQLTAYHPELEVEPALLPRQEVRVTASEQARVELLLPGLATVAAAHCAAETGGQGAVVAGMVRDRSTGVPLSSARVELRPADGRGAALHTVTAANGQYRFCAVPTAGGHGIRASFASHHSPTQELVVAEPQTARADLAIDLRVPVRLVGRVLDGETGQPLPSTRVRVLGTDGTTLTNAQGRFAMENVPSGEHRIEVTHVAYGTHSEAVTIGGAGTADLTIHLGVRAIAIEGVVATARRTVGLEDFHRRMEASRGGTFLDRTAIERRGASRVEHMLGEYGIVVDAVGVVMPRGLSGFDRCGPMVFIDGIAVTKLDPDRRAVLPTEAREALRMVNPSQLAGIEIYRGASQIPIELGGTGGGCGVIALWTRRS
jgi:hypothetical protein